ncbi:MAG TPA: DNA repair protein RecO [Verrucomicrobiae bacterium]|nr:DNA repair protein RecO [Verrucomicrobiae bacterium]
MDEKTHGLILRTRPLTETSLIVHWLTPEAGRIATVAKGARRPKSPFRGKLDLFHMADFSFVRSRRSELHLLREVSLRDTHRALREDLHLLRQAAYCALLIEQCTETSTPLPGIFGLMKDLLTFLPSHPAGPLPVLAFEVKLLAETGLQPDPAQSNLSLGARQGLQQLTSADWDLLAKLRLSPNQITELSQFLHGFLHWHLGRLPVGRAAALAQ